MTKRTPPPPQPAPARLRWPIAAGAALVIGIAAVAVWRLVLGHGATFPPPVPGPTSRPVSATAFLGSEACASCHVAEYEAWRRSTHGRAGGPPTRERVIAPFDGRAMRFRDAVVTPAVAGNGTYVFTIDQRNRPPQVFQVIAVVGGGFMAGGGTQAFFSRFPDGTVRFLPFDFSRAFQGWVCNTNRRVNRGLVPITPALSLADCGDWPPMRVLGSDERFESCQQCHGSQIQLEYDTTAKHYVTRYTTLAINCESCHGPGRRHVDAVRSGRGAAGADIGMRALGVLAKDQSLSVCFQCHAVKATLHADYLPGSGLERHFALKFPGLVDTLYFADGRTRGFAYQEGHLSSDCYLNGSMTCVDCHDPHSQHYRDFSGTPLPGRFDDRQCLDCHPSKAERVDRHTHHRATSPGSRCTACHMPYLQEPSVGPRVRYARSDHTISIPRPLYDSRLGIEDGCAQCHAGMAPERLQAQVSTWYGEFKPQPRSLAAAVRADSLTDRLAAARVALADSGHDPVAAFAALGAFFLRYLHPDMPDLEGEIVRRLETLTGADDLDVRALALACLHLARGSDPAVRRFLARRLRDVDSAVLTRDRWAWTLRARGSASLQSGDYEEARASYAKALEIEPEDAAALRGLGIAYTRLGNYARATELLKRSLAVRPTQPQVLVELAFAAAEQGDVTAAVAMYRRALALNPWEPAAYANLGLTYLQLGEVDSAIVVLRRAVDLDPSLASANFALASAYQRSGRQRETIAALERGLEFDPTNASARQLLEALRGGQPSP